MSGGRNNQLFPPLDDRSAINPDDDNLDPYETETGDIIFPRRRVQFQPTNEDDNDDDEGGDNEDEEEEVEVDFSAPPEPNTGQTLFQQSWLNFGLGAGTPFFDPARRRSLIDPLRNPSPTTPPLRNPFGRLRTGVSQPLPPQPPQPSVAPAVQPAQPSTRPPPHNQPVQQSQASTQPTATMPGIPGAPTAPANPTGRRVPQSSVTTATTTVDLNGDQFVVRSAPSRPPTTSSCLYKKEDRSKLPHDERHTIIEEATKKSSIPKFKPLQLALIKNKGKDDSLLQEDANLHGIIKSIEARHKTYDLHSPFTIVFPRTDFLVSPLLRMDGLNPLTVDLFRMYLSVHAQQVAISNYWYNCWADPVSQPWHRENLHLSYLLLMNHTEHVLHVKVMETYDKYAPEFHGGPLYFKLLMDLLVADLQNVADSVLKHIQNFKIRDIKGEDVSKAVTLLRNGCDRLHSVHRLPEDMTRTLVKVFQTTSNHEFNAYFAALEIDFRRDPMSSKRDQFAIRHFLFQNSGTLVARLQDQIRGECDLVLDDADRIYLDLLYPGHWRVAKGNSDPAALNVTETPPDPKRCLILKASVLLAEDTCWNCGQKGHRLTDCPHPKNDKQIEVNRKAYNAAKAKQGDGSSDNRNDRRSDRRRGGHRSKKSHGNDPQYAPPKKGEGNKRVIDNKPMFWHYKTKRWVDDKFPSGSAHTAAPPASQQTTPAPPGPNDDTVQALLADSTGKFKDAMHTIAALLDKVKNKV